MTRFAKADSVWILLGFYLDSAWIRLGFCGFVGSHRALAAESQPVQSQCLAVGNRYADCLDRYETQSTVSDSTSRKPGWKTPRKTGYIFLSPNLGARFTGAALQMKESNGRLNRARPAHRANFWQQIDLNISNRFD